MKEQYVISALKDVVFICEKDNDVYIGNVDIKVFNSKTEANKFLRTNVLKSQIDKAIPLNWYVVNIREITHQHEDKGEKYE